MAMSSTTTEVRTLSCIHCGTSSVVELDNDGLRKWQAGEFVHVAFPAMSVDEREVLISGTHPGCWEAMFADIESD